MVDQGREVRVEPERRERPEQLEAQRGAGRLSGLIDDPLGDLLGGLIGGAGIAGCRMGVGGGFVGRGRCGHKEGKDLRRKIEGGLT